MGHERFARDSGFVPFVEEEARGGRLIGSVKMSGSSSSSSSSVAAAEEGGVLRLKWGLSRRISRSEFEAEGQLRFLAEAVRDDTAAVVVREEVGVIRRGGRGLDGPARGEKSPCNSSSLESLVMARALPLLLGVGMRSCSSSSDSTFMLSRIELASREGALYGNSLCADTDRRGLAPSLAAIRPAPRSRSQTTTSNDDDAGGRKGEIPTFVLVHFARK